MLNCNDKSEKILLTLERYKIEIEIGLDFDQSKESFTKLDIGLLSSN